MPNQGLIGASGRSITGLRAGTAPPPTQSGRGGSTRRRSGFGATGVIPGPGVGISDQRTLVGCATVIKRAEDIGKLTGFIASGGRQTITGANICPSSLRCNRTLIGNPSPPVMEHSLKFKSQFGLSLLDSQMGQQQLDRRFRFLGTELPAVCGAAGSSAEFLFIDPPGSTESRCHYINCFGGGLVNCDSEGKANSGFASLRCNKTNRAISIDDPSTVGQHRFVHTVILTWLQREHNTAQEGRAWLAQVGTHGRITLIP